MKRHDTANMGTDTTGFEQPNLELDPGLAAFSEKLNLRARQLARRDTQQHVKLRSFLGCVCGSEALLISVQDLRAVTGFADCVPLPLAPAELLGIGTLRGKIVSVLDLARLLDLPPSVDQGPGYILFLRTDPVIGMRVDQLLGLIDIDVTLAGALGPSLSPYLGGLTRDGHLMLDLARLIHHPLLAEVSI